MNKENKIHWLEWSKTELSKGEGGLGFRDIGSFNQAILAKQGQKILANQKSLATRIFKEKYLKQGCFMNAKLGNNPSQVQRSIWEAKQFLNE